MAAVPTRGHRLGATFSPVVRESTERSERLRVARRARAARLELDGRPRVARAARERVGLHVDDADSSVDAWAGASSAELASVWTTSDDLLADAPADARRFVSSYALPLRSQKAARCRHAASSPASPAAPVRARARSATGANGGCEGAPDAGQFAADGGPAVAVAHAPAAAYSPADCAPVGAAAARPDADAPGCAVESAQPARLDAVERVLLRLGFAPRAEPRPTQPVRRAAAPASRRLTLMPRAAPAAQRVADPKVIAARAHEARVLAALAAAVPWASVHAGMARADVTGAPKRVAVGPRLSQ
ncbi:hypothetical protein KFE25_012765 [Diacronema lutheri]|uniref:Uncharacterized protein n=1 Tax=Diacronema lutheri TaxID=2081491 RepID=A0A8J6C5G3_DIALT|nr:hypothetical protein KFE25_012765 [Diacronema lutheri]